MAGILAATDAGMQPGQSYTSIYLCLAISDWSLFRSEHSLSVVAVV